MTGRRFLDVAGTALGLVLVSPLLILIGLAIRLDSPGPVIFSQKRLGLNGTIFQIHKFRKYPPGYTGTGLAVQDTGMTPVGAFLEKTKLDELPQLWNVLVGEMALVGPRPEILRFESLFQGPYRKLFDYRPGIFGPSQVAYRNEAEMFPEGVEPERYYREVLFPAKAEIDLAYYRQATPWSDLAWIVRSIAAVLFGGTRKRVSDPRQTR